MWYEIHPAIGIARLGSSGTTDASFYFFGPEPNCTEANYADPDFTYGPSKGRVRYEADGATQVSNYRVTPNGRLKRQAARFRVFQCDDASGTLERHEIDYDKIGVEWIVDLANRKSAGLKFANGAANPGKRNQNLKAPQLAIRSKTWHDKLSGASQGPKAVLGSFGGVGTDIELGQLATDAKGRLLVIGPAGQSGSNDGSDPVDYADNDNWYDNTSDGPVIARLYDKLDGNKPIQAEVRNGWVLVTPFDFAPDVDSFISLYDVCRQACVNAGHLPAPSDTWFKSDVLPLLKRVRGYRWVNGPAIRAETQDRHKSWRDAEAALGNPNHAEGAIYRKMLLAHLPSWDGDKTGKRQVLMPRLHSDTPGADQVLRLTKIQYQHLQNWAANDFQPGARAENENLADALDRIALEACSGGAFYPGMEAPRIVRETAMYSGPFRLRPRLDPDGYPLDPSLHEPEDEIAEQLLPGQLTEGLAVPWQADFWQCQMERENGWWPATRPDHVFFAQPQAAIDSQSEEVYRWDEGIHSEIDMVRSWHRLGVVRRKPFEPNKLPAPDPHDPRAIADVEGTTNYYFVEDERDVTQFPHKKHSSGEDAV